MGKDARFKLISAFALVLACGYLLGAVTYIVDKLEANVIGGDAWLECENTGDGNESGLYFTRERLSGTGQTGAAIYLQSNTADNNSVLEFGVQTSLSPGTDPVQTWLELANTHAIGSDPNNGIFALSFTAGAEKALSLFQRTATLGRQTHIEFQFQNDAGTPEQRTYARLSGYLDDDTDGAEDGRVHMTVCQAGSLGTIQTWNESGGMTFGGDDSIQLLPDNSANSLQFGVKGGTVDNVEIRCDNGTVSTKGNFGTGVNPSTQNLTGDVTDISTGNYGSVRFVSDSLGPWTINGITGTIDGHIFTIHNVDGVDPIILGHTSDADDNDVYCPGGSDWTIDPHEAVTIIYHAATPAKWRFAGAVGDGV